MARAYVSITPHFLMDMFTQGIDVSFLVKEGVPRDARFLCSYYNQDKDILEIWFHSTSLPDDQDGKPITVI